MSSDMTDKYNTPLSADEEEAFQKWAKSSGRDLSQDLPVYDMRGFWKSQGSQADNGHFPDTYKKPSHPTFSTDSQYSGVDGNEGGTWTKLDGDKWNFTPGATNLKNNSAEEIQDYLTKGDPTVTLVLPQDQATQGAAAQTAATSEQVQSDARANAAVSAFGHAAATLYPDPP